MITSTSNSGVKAVRALRRRDERERTRLFYAEGIRAAGEAAELEAQVETCVVAPELLTSDYGRAVAERLLQQGARRLEVTAEIFRGISTREGPQGIALVARQRWTALDEIIPGSELCWIALASVQDPGNLGTILRTADAVGAAGVLLLGNSADPYDPAAVRASMGAIFAQRLVRTTPAALEAWKRRHGVTVVGTSDSAALDYLEAGYPPPLVLLMGSEREGLSPDEKSVCDTLVRIPMSGRSDSLNLAVATGVMLYELARRRRQDGPGGADTTPPTRDEQAMPRGTVGRSMLHRKE